MDFKEKLLQYEEEDFVLKNEKLIYFTLHRLGHNSNDPELIQLGRLTLLKAHRSFDPTRGLKFSSYFFQSMKNTIIKQYYENKNSEITNYDFLENSSHCSLHEDSILSSIEDKNLCEKLFSQLSPDEIEILKDIYYNENTLRNFIPDKIGDIKTEKLYRRRFRSHRAALNKAREIVSEWTGKA